MAGFTVKRFDEIPGVPDPDPGDPDWKPLRHHLGLDGFGADVFVQNDAGGRPVEAGTALLAVGGEPGKAFQVSAWDAKWTSGLEQA